MTRKKEEEQHQKAFVQWFKIQYPRYKDHITLPSFGENVGPIAMKRLKDMGLTPGWPDIFIAIPKVIEHHKFEYKHNGPVENITYDFLGGLFIEMKSKGQKLKPHQKEMHDNLARVHYKVVTCWSCDEAISETKEYLNNES